MSCKELLKQKIKQAIDFIDFFMFCS